MVIIIKKEKGKAVYNNINFSEEDKSRAHRLDEVLAKIVPEIEQKWEGRMVPGQGKKVDIRVVHQIGKILADVVDDEKLVSPNERRWVWKAIREMYLAKNSILKRGETRDDLEYLYKISKYPIQFAQNISWDGWRKLFESTIVNQDARFEKWFRDKASKWYTIPRGMIREFTKVLFSFLKNKDTTVLSDKEIHSIYQKAWDAARIKHFVEKDK